jgi:hypothetical protein
METELQPLIDLAREAALSNPESIETAVDAALSAAQELPEFPEFTEALVRRAVRGMVEEARHSANVEMRSRAGGYGGPAKVVVGEATARVMRSLYLYAIGGKTLGQLTGKELAATAESEQARADGHLFNVRLCSRLAEIVPEEKSVEEAVSERKLKTIWKELG